MRRGRLLWSFFRRDALTAISYRTAFLMPIVSVVSAVPIFYFLSQAFTGADTAALGAYRGRYFAFILLGVAFQDYVTLSMSQFLNGIREQQLMGTMEVIMLSPTPVPMILLCSSAWGFAFTSIRFLLYILCGLMFGIDFSGANLTSFAFLGGLALVSFAALGILGAAVTLIIKQGSSITGLLTAATLALGGVLYPISVMPEWLQKVALLLPFTHALAGVRKALMLGARPGDLMTEFLALGIFGVVLFPISLWVFELALRRVKATGTLGQY